MMNIHSYVLNITMVMVFCFMVGSCLFSVYYFRKNMMLSLIMMEFTTLSVFMSSVLVFTQLNQTISLSFYILVLGACEASMGLSLLINMTRFKGNDMLSMVSSFKY